MQTKSLQMTRAMRTALLVLLLSAVGVRKGYAINFDFSATCPSGQTLYYKIIDATNHYVKIACPHSEDFYSSTPWGNYPKPTGDIVLPSNVSYNGISYNVIEIGIGAFYYCSGLTGSLTIPNSITSIGDCAFSGCNGFSGGLTLSNSTTTIGGGAFQGCSGFTSNLTIPNSVTTIGSLAFQNCSGFTGCLTIPNSVTMIDRQAFINCNGFSEVYYNAVNCDDVSSTCVTYSWFPFDGVRGTFTIGNNVERIPAHMFRSSLFTGSLTIPNSVTSIGSYAFDGCSGFTGSLTIGNSVTSIGACAFNNCSGFSDVYFNAVNCEDGSDNYTHSFSGINGQLIFGENVERIPGRIFNWGDFTGSLTIPNSVTEIGSLAFSSCSGFTGDLTIGNSVTMIGENAFAVYDGFTGVRYSGDITQWCNITFANSTSNPLFYAHNLYIDNNLVTNLTIPESINEINDYAFNGCSCFTTLTIPTSVTEIGVNAFSFCTGLIVVDYYAPNCSSISNFAASPIVTVNIGENVQSIPSNAFANCTTLNTIIALGITPPSLGINAFAGISPVATLFVPCGSLMAYFSNWNMFEYNNIHEDCTPRPVSISPNITGGTITPSVSQATMGQEVMLTVSPNAGMQLASITAYNTNNPSQIVPISPIGNSYRFVMPPYAVTISATFDTCVLVEENSIVTANVYPNPTTGHVKIETEDIRHIRINNMLGQVIYESMATGNEFEYDFNKYSEGVYLIRIETASGVVTKRVVVTR